MKKRFPRHLRKPGIRWWDSWGFFLSHMFQTWNYRTWQPGNANGYRPEKHQRKPVLCSQRVRKGKQYGKHLDHLFTTSLRNHKNNLLPTSPKPTSLMGEPRFPLWPGCKEVLHPPLFRPKWLAFNTAASPGRLRFK